MIPGRHKIGGELLKLNFDQCSAANMASIIKEALLTGMTFLGNGATITKMPLINVIVMAGDCLPVITCIHDCVEHMQAGGKKDTPYIAGLFEEHVSKFDPLKMHADAFMFDGAYNNQKAG